MAEQNRNNPPSRQGAPAPGRQQSLSIPPGNARQGQGTATPPARTSSLPALQLPRPPLFRELDAAQRFLEQIASKVHLLSPVVNLDIIPEFHEVSVRYVRIDPSLDGGDVYKQKGGKGVSLTKTALDRVATAAGLRWHPTLSGRLDDGSDPHYCHFRIVAVWPQTDGSMLPLKKEREIDLRDGNPNIFTDDETRMARKYDERRRCYTEEILNRGFVKGWSKDRLEGAREHILAMAESKAANRIVRSIGVKQVYTPEELEKPFAILALVLTGRSGDAELEREAKKMLLHDALQKSRSMFGPELDMGGPARNITPQLEKHEPPPVGAAKPTEDDEEPDDDQPIDVTDFQPVCGCPQEREGIHRENCDGFGPA